MTENFGIAAFRSRQQVLRLQSALRRAGLKAEVVATPKDVAIGCGLSVQFDLNQTESVLQTYRKLGASNLIGFYSVERVDNKTSRLTPLTV
ncbi:MAG: DUF3343 domain-containing protein [Oscillospiraceae bacterium]|jgi:hypothetical protein|nr:DUF3343 domain-containing protein [Oscillospiraceae bacterium]